MEELKPYLEYRDSGVPWLGVVPEHWRIIPGRACFAVKHKPNTNLAEKTVLTLSYGRIIVKPEDKLHGLVPASFETYQIVEPGDIICRPTDLQNDKTSLRFGLSGNKGIITSAYICFRTSDGLDYHFGYLLLHTYDLNKIFYGLGSGLRQNLDWQDFKTLPCVLPSLTEQVAIVRFLDHIDRRIRRNILAKQKLIKLLEEYKHVIIHHAVTRGLDPNVSLKPSTVEWLGEVPEHWEVVPLRWYISIRSGDFIGPEKISNEASQDRPVPVIGGNGIMGYSETSNTSDVTIVIGRVGALCGNVHLINILAWITDNALKVSRIKDFDPEFLAIQMRDMNINRLANANAQPLITGGLIKSLNVAKPPLWEQQKFVYNLRNFLKPIEAIIAGTRHEISLIEEYRTSLISDVVTGKMDVRGIDLPAAYEDTGAPVEDNNLFDQEAAPEDCEIPEDEIQVEAD